MIRKIMCCCGNGVGTSMMMQLTVEEALEILGREDIEVTFGPLAAAFPGAADLFVVSEEVLSSLEGLPVAGLTDLLDAEDAAGKLKQFVI